MFDLYKVVRRKNNIGKTAIIDVSLLPCLKGEFSSKSPVALLFDPLLGACQPVTGLNDKINSTLLTEVSVDVVLCPRCVGRGLRENEASRADACEGDGVRRVCRPR